jgi:hypothetical protein
MSTALLDEPMVEKPKTLPVKLHVDVIESARIVSAFRGEAMSDMLSGLLRPILAKMEQEEMTRRMKPRKPKGGSE